MQTLNAPCLVPLVGRPTSLHRVFFYLNEVMENFPCLFGSRYGPCLAFYEEEKLSEGNQIEVLLAVGMGIRT